MIFGINKTIEDSIIEALKTSMFSVLDLQKILEKDEIYVSIQAIYKSIRKLMISDIIVKNDKKYSISSLWIKKIQNTFPIKTKIKLEKGETITYKFTHIEHIDIFWKDIVFNIHDENHTSPVFYANAHNFWYLFPGRKESDANYYQYLIKNNQYIFGLIGGKTPLDKLLKQEYGHDFVKFHFDDKFPISRRDHITIIDSYIITARISNSLVPKIDNLYLESKNEDELKQQLYSLLIKPGKMTLSIENNETKARKLRKRMAKDFYIPRELVEKYDLF
jgi:hypothetical protein